MSSMFARKPIAQLEPPTDATQSLKRVLGAGDLMIPQAGSAYACTYATLGEIVA